LVFVNDHFLNDIHQKTDGATAISIYDLIHWDDLGVFREAMKKCPSGEGIVEIKTRLKNNAHAWVDWEIKFQKNASAQKEGFLCIGHNKPIEGTIKKSMEMKALNSRLVEGGFPDGVILYGKKGTEPVFNQKVTTSQGLVNHVQYSQAREGEGEEKKSSFPAKSRELLNSSFLAHTPYFSWIVDKDENLLFANQSLLQYFNGDESAFGKNIFNLIPESIASVFHRRHMAVIGKTLPVHSLIRSLMADGKEHIFQVTVFPIHQEGEDMKIGGEALDVTETWLTKQAVKEANQRLSYISKATSEAIWDWNMKTGKIFGNQALHDLIGAELDKVTDLGWCYQCIHPEDLEKVEQRVRKVLEKKEQSWDQEFRFRYRDGSYKMVLKRGFIIYENEEAVRMICTLQDISEIKELEHQLVEQKLKQQKGIAEAIIQAQEMERNRIGNELHDNVNQILSTAQLYLNTMDPAREDAYDLKDRTKAILSLAIEEIRKLSREMVVPNLREDGLIKSVSDLVEDIRFANPFRIVFEHSESRGIESLGQQKKITLLRIIQEQIKNVVTYSKASNVEISLNCYHDQVRLYISDDGIGFDPKNTPRGLGLSNIYERTRLYNGKVILHTAPGMGCSLIVNIPLEVGSFFESRGR
jgi:PAS domain S-box-containing protein